MLGFPNNREPVRGEQAQHIREELFRMATSDSTTTHPLFWQQSEVPDFHNPLIKDELRKILFLDIDGVLNTEDYSDPVAIHDERVARLARIVHTSRAEIVLTSSWRSAIRAFNACPDRLSETVRNRCLLLQSAFEKYDLHLASATDELTTGPNARPLEIRCWLAHRPQVERFVILDDDGFWTWRWLQPYVVRTQRTESTPDGRTIDIRGLEDTHVEQAIQILMN